MKQNVFSPWPVRALLGAAGGLLFVGHMLPWAAHRTAALTLSGHDLAAFTNLTPGAGVFLNEWFYLSLWAAAMLLALATAGAADWPARLLGSAAAVGIAGLGLPPYPHVLTAYADPNYRLQFELTLGVIGLVIVIVLLRPGLLTKQRRTAGLILMVLGLVAAVPLVGYIVVRVPIEQLYRDTVGIGIGWWLTLVGAFLALVAGAHMLQSRNS